MTQDFRGQLLHNHWKLLQRLTNDEEEAQRLALHVLETFDQFKPDRSTFAQFIKLKFRELRHHYADKGAVNYPGQSIGYISFDEMAGDDGGGDDEEIERNLYNVSPAAAAPIRLDLSRLSKRQRRIMELRLAGCTQNEVANEEGVSLPRIAQIEEAARSGVCVDEVSEIYRDETSSRRPAHCEKLNDLGGFRIRTARIPGLAESAKPNWISPKAREKYPRYYQALRAELRDEQELNRGADPLPARKRVSPELFRREEQPKAAYASLIKSRIYYAQRVTGGKSLPKDTLWEKSVPEFLKWYWTNALRDFKSKSRGMAWRRWIGLMERSRLAWLCEWRRAWMAFGGPSIYRSIELGDVIEISLHEEGWAFANTDPRRKIERRAGRGRWRGDDLTQ